MTGEYSAFNNLDNLAESDKFKNFQERLHFFLKQGLSFPKARANVLSEIFPDLDESFLSSSNNILGIEYCRALKYFNSSITPMTITRKDNLYNDDELAEEGKLSSATAIRKVLNEINYNPIQNTDYNLNNKSFNKRNCR